MQGREKLLVVVTVVVILLWQGLPFYNRVFVEPIESRNGELLRLEDELAQRERTQRSIRRAHSNLVAWRQKSLPADALNAQRLYLEWLTDLANLSGFSELKVTPPKTSARAGKVYTPIQVKIDAQATYEQLCRFLDRFHKGELLHRIAEMDVKVPKEGQKDKLTISLTTEGLSVKGSEKHDQLLPRTEFREDVSQSATTLNVASNERFPHEQQFLARSGTEILKVINVSATTWTVERASESTSAANHAKGDAVELFHVVPKKPNPAVDLQAVVSGNLFTKPSLKTGPTDPLDGEYAKNTWLRQLWSSNDEWEARLFDASNKMKILHKGSTFRIESLEATVAEIHPDHVMLQIGKDTKKLYLGRNLQSMKEGGGSDAGSAGSPESSRRGGPRGEGSERMGRDRPAFDPSDPRIQEFRERMKRGEFRGRGGEFGKRRSRRGGGSQQGSDTKDEKSDESTTQEPAE
ncbi:MAG: hypothetical protein WD648_05985, partial [Planctomycetaceae bacterium]